MEGISYIEKNGTPAIKADGSLYEIPFSKDRYYLMVFENYVNFIKGCENLIRNMEEYSQYKASLYAKGLTRCQILGNIDANFDEDITVEMHHGPIFTLFDYCGCVLTHLVKQNHPKITTFRIASIVMQEHFDGNIQTVMLSKTAHQAVDSNKVFINLDMANGDLGGFLDKYSDGLLEDQKIKINKYIDLSKKYNSTDNGLFKLEEHIKDWSQRRHY